MSGGNSFIPGSTGTAVGSNVPIAHLDYAYVKECTSANELEEIITVLRSGSEGFYPDLLQFTEKKLQEINPKSDVLRKDKPARNVKDLDADDKKMVTEDLLNWMNEANDMDKKLQHSNGEAGVNNVDELPPVRSKKTIVDEGKKTAKASASSSKKRVKPRDYNEWDKFDIEKELENADKEEEICSKSESDKSKSETKSKAKIEPVPIKDLNEEERLLRATREKEKGNEAYRAQDYGEAVVYYTNSLKYEPTAASYNNRAAAELKIEKYAEAIEDCIKVLQLEPNNIKAFLRRGMAYKALKNQELAVEDFESMLKIDPNNKRAKDLLAEVESSNRPAGSKTKRKGQRLKIVEIESGDDVMGENRDEQSATGSGVEENNKNGDVEKSGLETSNGILGDLKVVNGVKREQEGISVDNTVDGEALGNADDKNNVTVAKEPGTALGTPGAQENETGANNDVTGSLATEVKIGRQGQPTSENGDGSGVAEGEGLPSSEKVENAEKVVLEIPPEVKSLMNEGNELYKMGHHSEALVKYTKCVKHLWEDRESYASAVSGLLNNKAACYFKMGECKQCVLQCNKSLKLVDCNLKALIRRGTAYEAMEKYAEAFRDFNRVRLIDGSNKIAQEHCSRVIKHLEMLHGKYWRKKIFEISGDDEGKNHTFPDVNKTNENPVQISVNKASLQPENSPSAGGKEAKIGMKEGGKEEPGSIVRAQFLKLKESGNALVKKGKHEEAIKHYTECVKLCPDEVAVYTNRALCYLKLARYDLAEADCDTALKIETDNLKALFRRGKARKGLGRYRDASEDLVRVLKLDSKNNAAKTELTDVLALLKKERQDEITTKKGESSSGKKAKSAPKRKKILIQDVDGDDDKKKPSEATAAKNKDTPKADHKENTTAKAKKTTPIVLPPRDDGKASGPPPMEKAKSKGMEKNTKGSRKVPVQHNVKSAFQFLQAWKSVKNNPTEHLNILKQVNLAELPKIISTKLDADMIKSIFEALNHEIESKGDVKFVYQFLQKLTSVDRFEITLMFLSAKEKQVPQKLFDNIVKQNTEQTGIKGEDLGRLRQKYNV